MGRHKRDGETPVASLRRDEVLGAAVRIMSRRGFRGTSLRDIAAEVGFTQPALYYYFRSKEELLYIIYMDTLEVGLSALQRIAEHDLEPEEELRQSLGEIVRLIATTPSVSILFTNRNELSPKHQMEATRKERLIVDHFRQVHERGIAAGGFHPMPSVVVSFGILGMAAWVYRWFDESGPRTVDQVVEVFAQMVLHGIRSDRA